jgi:hypothetical protein
MTVPALKRIVIASCSAIARIAALVAPAGVAAASILDGAAAASDQAQ